MQINFEKSSDSTKLMRAQAFNHVWNSDFQGAHAFLDDCLSQCEFQQLDAIRSLQFDQSPSDIMKMVSEAVVRLTTKCDLVAISLDLEISNQSIGEWCCTAFAYEDLPSYPISRKSNEELRADVRKGNCPWIGCFASADECSGFFSLPMSGFGDWEDIVYNTSFDDKKTRNDWSIARTATELMIGVQFHELVSTALQTATNTERLPIFVQGHDDANIPVGVYWTSTHRPTSRRHSRRDRTPDTRPRKNWRKSFGRRQS